MAEVAEQVEQAKDQLAGEPVAEEVLVEEVSIDGMCGVY
jgi:mycofactocin precursor